ncbi:MAG: Gfo/Idh/MocA family oxidoreductase [Planctomycetes bacterium]|nr:Gfo/Idh/MocA family oxidoreductase [Planctomycetota bacterium]
MQDVGLGIVGLGAVTEDLHLPSVKETNGINLRAVADITPARREALASALSCPIYTTLGELLEHDGVDLVIVATPSSMHHQHVMEALSAGKHVMVEKPLAVSLAHAQEMEKLAGPRTRKIDLGGRSVIPGLADNPLHSAGGGLAWIFPVCAPSRNCSRLSRSVSGSPSREPSLSPIPTGTRPS